MAVWSITELSSVTHFDRIDGEYYLPSYLSNHDVLSSIETVPLPQRFLVSDGNHLSVSKYFSDSAEIPYFRGQDVNDFFLENASPVRIPEKVYNSSMMQRSHFQEADVLLSIVGTIGSLSVVPKSIGSATGSCKIAILRSKGEYSPFVLAAFLLSKYGQLQIKRNTRGAVQMGLILKDLIRIRVPLFSDNSVLEIEELVKNAIVSNNQSKEFHDQSQQLLESELGFDKLSYQKPVGYTARFSELELSRRLDAQHYQAQFTRLLDHLAKFPTRKVRDIRTCNRRGIQPIYVTDGTYDVINSQHLGPKHINYDGLEKTSPRYFAASPVAHIRKNDLLIYTTGAYIGRTNVYLSDAPAFASNHVNILRITPSIDAGYMAMVFQSVVGQFQTQKHSRGSAQAELYPNDIDKFVVPILPFEQQTIIGDLVRESLVKQRESARLLEQAKNRVEQLIVEQLIEEAVQS